MKSTIQTSKKSKSAANRRSRAKGKNFLPLAQVSANNRRVDADGNLLSYPELMANVGATFRFMDKKLFVSPAVRYTGIVTYRTRTPATSGTEITNYYTDEIGPFTYMDLNIGYEPTAQFGVYLNFNNLLDEDGPIHQSVWNGTIGQYGRYIEVKAVYRFK